MRQRSRGNVLLVVLICLVAISLLGAGILRLTGFSLSNARHRETSVELSSCAQAVRQYVSSWVKANPTAPFPTDTFSFTIPGTSANIVMNANHYTPDPANLMKTLTPPVGTASTFGTGGSGGTSVENLANAMPMGVGSPPVRHTAVALCTDANGRTYEVEYSFASAN
jgi:Tfp pilus assembly protein PilX